MAPPDQFAKSAWMLASIAVVVATLAEAQEPVRLLIRPLLPPPEKQARPDAGPTVMEGAHQ